MDSGKTFLGHPLESLGRFLHILVEVILLDGLLMNGTAAALRMAAGSAARDLDRRERTWSILGATAAALVTLAAATALFIYLYARNVRVLPGS